MKTCILCFSDSGAMLALLLKQVLENSEVHTTGKFAAKYGFIPHASISEDMGQLFHEHDALVFISAAGIAVRYIAPYVEDKTKDPAVVVMDDRGRFVIPVLSGHIGGANALAEQISALIGSVPVVTTATDGAGKFSCDAWAAQHGCSISSMKAAKDVSAAILTDDVPVSSEYDLPEELPAGLVSADEGPLGIYIGIHNNEPYDSTLRLIPRVVSLGIGCRKGTPADVIYYSIREVLENNNIDIQSVFTLASIDVKKDEQGLLECAGEMGIPVVYHTAAELDSLEGDFEESAFVRQTVGTGNVCERAALMNADRLIIRKTARNGVTVAAAVKDWRIEF